MARSQRDESVLLAAKERTAGNKKRTRALLRQGGKGRIEITVRASIQNNKPLSEGTGGILHVSELPVLRPSCRQLPRFGQSEPCSPAGTLPMPLKTNF